MRKKIQIKKQKGFTLIELMVTVMIFVVMSSILLSKYANFNQDVLLKNLAYDVALTIRQAQSYALNVKSATNTTNEFNAPYGVYFDKSVPMSFIFFQDRNRNGLYDGEPTDKKISDSNIKYGNLISALCVGNPCTDVTPVDSGKLGITFKRPDPNAIITTSGGTYSYAEITVKSTSDSLKKIIVRSTGQIEVPL